ncbi:glycosyl transferase family protein [Acetobacter orientalis]|uniref:glycosyl transferase family protein n=1 Tax=Acetobacter orientalis TaxID=146474 RepID=UPI0039ED5841
MFLYFPYFIADYYRWLEHTVVVVAAIILLSSLDDLFIDAWYWVRHIVRLLSKKRWYKPLSPEQLRDKPEQHIAIMIPAWLEYDVIASMLENMVGVLDYRSYTIFVGTYRNDTKTIDAVERMRRRYRQLVRVEVAHDGPTCKADCLNWIVQAIFAHEKQKNMFFAGMVLHDSEDVLHPLELQFFNYLLPRKDLIQIPVCSLERNWYELVAGVYMDEFSEWHGKDLVVRESLAKTVPSAGVGTCFSRRAMLTLVNETHNEPFNTQTLTEDYDIGVRLAEHGMASIMARFPVEYQVKRVSWFGYGKVKEQTVHLPLCVREYFPNTFRTSYRQKARWSLGICFQGMAHFGWSGSLIDRYFLLRDRKGAITTLVAIFAYVLAAQYVIFQCLFWTGLVKLTYPPLITNNTWITVLLKSNAVALLLRIVQRAYFTQRIFGWEHGLLSIPRLVVGNFVNFVAVSRAWKQYITYLITGRRLVWDKTMHDFPSADGLISPRRLGDILLSWQAIDESHLQSALEVQNEKSHPLGRILVSKGWLSEDVLAEAIAFQSGLNLIKISDADVLAAKDLFPFELSIRWRIIPLPDGEKGKIKLAVSAPLKEQAKEQIQKVLDYMPLQIIVTDSDITVGLRLLQEGKSDNLKQERNGPIVPLLGDILVDLGDLSPQTRDHVLLDYSPERDGPFGGFLVACGVITPTSLQKALDAQKKSASDSKKEDIKSSYFPEQ